MLIHTVFFSLVAIKVEFDVSSIGYNIQRRAFISQLLISYNDKFVWRNIVRFSSSLEYGGAFF